MGTCNPHNEAVVHLAIYFSLCAGTKEHNIMTST